MDRHLSAQSGRAVSDAYLSVWSRRASRRVWWWRRLGWSRLSRLIIAGPRCHDRLNPGEPRLATNGTALYGLLQQYRHQAETLCSFALSAFGRDLTMSHR